MTDEDKRPITEEEFNEEIAQAMFSGAIGACIAALDDYEDDVSANQYVFEARLLLGCAIDEDGAKAALDDYYKQMNEEGGEE